MRKFYLSFGILLSVMLLCGVSVHAQKAVLKTNLPYWGVGISPNAALEFGTGKKTTLELGGGFNFWDFSNNKKSKHWLVQPELRYWTCEPFNGHFFGLHAHYAQYNVGGWNVPLGRLDIFKDHRYEGWLYGAGVSWGHQWILSNRWNLEMSLGGGYARIHYRKYPCVQCGELLDEGDTNYFGVTKAAVSLIYVIK
ncbi:MAG: DUF3575 domain-containing protein [Fermentimonas sp.]